MTAASAASAKRGGNAGLVVGAVLLVGALLLIGTLSANTKSDIPFDPKSTSPTGTKALVELVDRLGGSVDVPDHFPVDADVAVLFEDVVPQTEVAKVDAWVREGHTLVVTDPFSDFTPPADQGTPHVGKSLSVTVDRGTCTVDALQNVGRLNRGVATGGEAVFRSTRTQVCFADEDGAFLVVTPLGQGQIVSLASGLLLTNRYLGQDDNAVLAADLFAPHEGTRLAVLGTDAFGSSIGGGGVDVIGSLAKLVSPGIRLLLLELVVAVVVYGVARGRRLGKPVAEPQPVQIAGSELVSAVGNLLQQTREPGNAAALLRADLRRQLCGRLGVPLDAAPAVLVDVIAERTGRERGELAAVLDDHPVASERDLVALAQHIVVIREEVLHGQPV